MAPFSSHTVARVDALKRLAIKMFQDGMRFPRFPGDYGVHIKLGDADATTK
jgi:hypothetical protein